MRLQPRKSMTKLVLGTLCLTIFGMAAVAEAGQRHPPRRGGASAVTAQRTVTVPVYQYQQPQVQVPCAPGELPQSQVATTTQQPIFGNSFPARTQQRVSGWR
jgi:hypothetical protein